MRERLFAGSDYYSEDEPLVVTPEIACGAGLCLFLLQSEGAEPTAEDKALIIETANYDLRRAGLEETVDEAVFATVRNVIGTSLTDMKG